MQWSNYRGEVDMMTGGRVVRRGGPSTRYGNFNEVVAGCCCCGEYFLLLPQYARSTFALSLKKPKMENDIFFNI